MPSSRSTPIFVISKIRWNIELNLLLTRIADLPERQAVLATVHILQQGRCDWCRQPLTHNVTTEHVVRRSSAAFAQLPPPVRWLTLRLSHPLCNQAHNRWSQRHPTAAAAQDALLAQIARSKVQNYCRQSSSTLSDPAQ